MKDPMTPSYILALVLGVLIGLSLRTKDRPRVFEVKTHGDDGSEIIITGPVPSQDIPSPGAAGPARAYPHKDRKGNVVKRDDCQGMNDTLYCPEGSYGPSGFTPTQHYRAYVEKVEK